MLRGSPGALSNQRSLGRSGPAGTPGTPAPAAARNPAAEAAAELQPPNGLVLRGAGPVTSWPCSRRQRGESRGRGRRGPQPARRPPPTCPLTSGGECGRVSPPPRGPGLARRSPPGLPRARRPRPGQAAQAAVGAPRPGAAARVGPPRNSEERAGPVNPRWSPREGGMGAWMGAQVGLGREGTWETGRPCCYITALCKARGVCGVSSFPGREVKRRNN